MEASVWEYGVGPSVFSVRIHSAPAQSEASLLTSRNFDLTRNFNLNVACAVRDEK